METEGIGSRYRIKPKVLRMPLALDNAEEDLILKCWKSLEWYLLFSKLICNIGNLHTFFYLSTASYLVKNELRI